MPRQRYALESIRQRLRRQHLRAAVLGHQKLMPQVLGRVASVEEGRLQDRVPGEGTVDARGVDPAPGLPLQIAVAADVVRVGGGVVNGLERPAVSVQNLPDLPPCVLVAAAVDEADLLPLQPHQADVGGTFDVVGLLRELYQFVHSVSPCYLRKIRPAFVPVHFPFSTATAPSTST